MWIKSPLYVLPFLPWSWPLKFCLDDLRKLPYLFSPVFIVIFCGRFSVLQVRAAWADLEVPTVSSKHNSQNDSVCVLDYDFCIHHPPVVPNFIQGELFALSIICLPSSALPRVLFLFPPPPVSVWLTSSLGKCLFKYFLIQPILTTLFKIASSFPFCILSAFALFFPHIIPWF